MTKRIFTSRTPTIDYQRCPRSRYIGYHAGPNGMGLEPVRKSYHLVLGAAVHAGLEVLLRDGATARASAEFPVVGFRPLENRAVIAARDEFDKEAGVGVVMDGQEGMSRTVGTVAAPDMSLTEMLRASLAQESAMDLGALGGGESYGLNDNAHRNPAVTGDGFDNHVGEFCSPGQGFAEVESPADYTLRELRALAEAMVRAYARRRLGPLLDEFDVLEVEREGEWKLGELEPQEHDWNGDKICKVCGVKYWEAHFDGCSRSLWFSSRPDALLLHRADQTLHLMSFKTTGAWDARKEKDAQRDVQGLSEAVEVERRLAGWWDKCRVRLGVNSRGEIVEADAVHELIEPVSAKMMWFLMRLPAPPRIHAVRYEYLIKGTRKQEDRGPLQGRWTSRSPLIRGYYNERTGEWAHTWTTTVEDELGTPMKKSLSWSSWKGKPSWDINDPNRDEAVRYWIDLLDSGSLQPGTDPLADQFPAPITVYRNDDDMRDWLEQVEAQEVKVARDVETMWDLEQSTAFGRDIDIRSNLNILFPQFRRSCSYPGECQFTPICYGSQDMRERPEESGLFRERIPNHKQELGQ